MCRRYPAAALKTKIVPAGWHQDKFSRIDPANQPGRRRRRLTIRPVHLAAVDRSEFRGDSNRDRDAQGVIMIENSRFLFNEEYGINIHP